MRSMRSMQSMRSMRSMRSFNFRTLPRRATVVLFQPPPLYPPLVDVAQHCPHVRVVDHDALFEPGIVRQHVVVAAEHQVRELVFRTMKTTMKTTMLVQRASLLREQH